MKMLTMWRITRGYEKSGVELAWVGWDEHILVLIDSALGRVPAVLGIVNGFTHGIVLYHSFS